MLEASDCKKTVVLLCLGAGAGLVCEVRANFWMSKGDSAFVLSDRVDFENRRALIDERFQKLAVIDSSQDCEICHARWLVSYFHRLQQLFDL